jgi:hypothetical protein
MHLSLLLCLAVVFVLAQTTEACAALSAGAAKSCITPPLGTRMNGGVGPSIATRIHDDLYVRALVLDDGTTRLAFAVVDTCLLDRPVFDEAKKLVQQHAGIAPERVMMSCTHTHSGGSACSAHLVEADEAYRAWLPGRIADAVRCAVSNLAPAKIAWGSGSLPQHVFCRRLQIKDGVAYTNQLGFSGERAKMNWDSPHAADGDPAGPTDPEVFVLSIQDTEGKPLALLANYSLHYVGAVGPGHVSADYYGVFADRLEDHCVPDLSRLGDPIVNHDAVNEQLRAPTLQFAVRRHSDEHNCLIGSKCQPIAGLNAPGHEVSCDEIIEIRRLGH